MLNPSLGQSSSQLGGRRLGLRLLCDRAGVVCRGPSQRFSGRGGAEMSVVFRVDPDYPIDPSRLPSTWTIAPLGDVVTDIRPGFASGAHNDQGIGVPHLRPMNIDRRGRIKL